MSISMYQVSVPALMRGLKQLQHVLNKGAAHAETLSVDQEVLVNARLFPNMLPLARQVYIATDTAKGCGARLAGQQPPSYDDIEITFNDLNARIEKTITYLNSFEASQIDGSEGNEIVLELGSHSVKFPGLIYLTSFALPNFYFHLTTAYNLLRHNGVELGKLDYLGAPQ